MHATAVLERTSNRTYSSGESFPFSLTWCATERAPRESQRTFVFFDFLYLWCVWLTSFGRIHDKRVLLDLRPADRGETIFVEDRFALCPKLHNKRNDDSPLIIYRLMRIHESWLDEFNKQSKFAEEYSVLGQLNNPPNQPIIRVYTTNFFCSILFFHLLSQRHFIFDGRDCVFRRFIFKRVWIYFWREFFFQLLKLVRSPGVEYLWTRAESLCE